MINVGTRVYRLGEFHPFSAGGRRFLYLVPAGAIFELDAAAQGVIDTLAGGEASHDHVVAQLNAQGVSSPDAQELIAELYHSRVIVAGDVPRGAARSVPPVSIVVGQSYFD